MSENKNVKLKYFGIPKLLPFVKPYKKIMISMIIMGAFFFCICCGDFFAGIFNI